MTEPVRDRWDPVRSRWVAGARTEDGARTGLWREWRADGSLATEGRYLRGVRHGTQREFHPDGALAVDSPWEHGRQGTTTFYAPAGQTDVEGFATIAPAVMWWREESDGGFGVRKTRHYDVDGCEVTPDGAPVPPRPPGVPHTARYLSGPSDVTPLAPARWVDGATELGTNRRLGVWSWWSAAGEPLWVERHDDRGRRRSGGSALDPDPAQVAFDSLVGADRPDVWGAVRTGWDEGFHQRVCDALVALGPAAVAAYLHLLEVGPGEGRPRPDLAIGLVDRWWAQQAGWRAGSDPILARGIGYAAAIVDRDRVRTWLHAMRDRTPEVDALAERILSGAADAELDRQAADPRGPTGVEVAARATRRPGLERVLGDGRHGVLVDPRGRACASDGAPLPLRIDRTRGAFGRYLLGVAETDERRLFAVGRGAWWAVQRYGTSLWLVHAQLDPQTVRVEVVSDVFVRCPDRGWTTDVVDRLRSALPAGAVEVDPRARVREYRRGAERQRLDPREETFDDHELALLRSGYQPVGIDPPPRGSPA